MSGWFYCEQVRDVVMRPDFDRLRCDSQLLEIPGTPPADVLFSQLDPLMVAQHFGSGFALVAALWWAGFAVRSVLALIKS